MTNDKAPDAFRTISEAAEYLGLEQHVLRFWETRFSQIKPLKRGGGRRYYRPDDVDFLSGLKHLLHDQRYTIKGVQKIIKEQGAKAVIAIGRGHAFTSQPVSAPAPAVPTSRKDQLEAALDELIAAKRALAAA
jgi:DNA-binding transcriptional MerR regulator